MTPFSMAASSTTAVQRQATEDSPLFNRIASDFKGPNKCKNELPDKHKRGKKSGVSSSASVMDGSGNGSMNCAVGVGVGVVGGGGNTHSGSCTITKKIGSQPWEKAQKTQLNAANERSSNKNSKHPGRQPKRSAPSKHNNIEEDTNNTNTKGITVISKIASAMSQLSNLKKRWNPPMSNEVINQKKRDRMNRKKVSKRKNQHEKRKQKRCANGKKKQKCDERTLDRPEKREEMVLNLDSGGEKDEVISPSAVAQDYSLTEDRNAACNSVEDDEEMDISEDEDDSACEKDPNSGYTAVASKVTCEDGEIVQNPTLQKQDREAMSNVSLVGNRNSTYNDISPGQSPTSACPDSYNKLSNDISNEQVMIDLYDALPDAKMTIRKRTIVEDRLVTKLRNDILIEEDIADLYDVMPDANITMREPKSLQKVQITELSNDTANEQRKIDSNTTALLEKLKTKLPHNVSKDNVANLYNAMTDAKLVMLEPAVLLKKHTTDPAPHVQEKKATIFDLAVPSLILTNDSFVPESPTTPSISSKMPLGIKDGQPKLDLLTPSSTPKSSESLAFKKARLARELNKAKIGKAKAKLRMAQIKKRDALRAKITREVHGKRVRATFSLQGGRLILSQEDSTRVDKINVCRSPPSGKNTAASTERKVIADVTAFKMSALMIFGITSSGTPEMVRTVSSAVLVDGEDCERFVDDSQPTKEVLQTAGTANLAVNSSKVIASDRELNVRQAPSSSLTLEEQKEKSNRRKLDLKLKKIRLQVKILEKAQATKKMKADSKKQSNLHSKHMHNDSNITKASTVLVASILTVKNEKNKIKAVPQDYVKGESILLTSEPESIALSVDGADSMQDIEKLPNHEGCTFTGDEVPSSDVQHMQDPKAIMGPRYGVIKKEEVINKLRERQTILKENINSSREANEELKYENGVSDLALLIQRQRKMLKYHGYKIGESKTSIQKCSKQLIQEKEEIIAAERKLEALLKRKKVMESMVLSTSTKLIDCRRKRGIMLKRLEETN